MNTPEPSLSFDDTLHLSLQALLQERQSLEACLDEYPQYAAELKPLLQTALLTQRLKKPVMSEARVMALEERLMKAFPAAIPLEEEPPTQPVSTRPSVLRFPAWMSRTAAIVALVVLAALGTGGGTVAASANSVPGETLYGVKRAWEEFILFFATLIGRIEDMRLHLAHVRWDELEILSAREQTIPNDIWQGFIRTFEAAYEEADETAQGDLMQVLANIDKTVPQAVLPASYREDLLRLSSYSSSNNQSVEAVTPVATENAAPSATVEGTATSTDVPTQALIVASTPTQLNMIAATATRTPTPSRTPTPTFTPSGTPTPLTPLPSPTATYTRLPLSIPSATAVIPTAPNNNPPEETGPNGLPLPPDEGGGGEDDPPVDMPIGTIDPIIRPTMRSVYATQTALASDSWQNEMPEEP